MAARYRLDHQLVERFVAVSQRADQHRQVNPGQSFHPPRIEQAAGGVTRRRAVHVGQHQYAVALIEFIDQVRDLGQAIHDAYLEVV